MDKPELNEVFSLQVFLKELLLGLSAEEVSWNFMINAHFDDKVKAIRFRVTLGINTYGVRREWLTRRITDLSMRHGLCLSTDWETADFRLDATFADVQAIRM